MTSEALDVYWGDDKEPIGQIVADGGATTFRYLTRPSAKRQISHSLPPDEVRAFPITFFENLLPDGIQRERLARRLGVSDESTFAMLRAVGGDCAGALSLVPEGEAATLGGGTRVKIDAEIVKRIDAIGVVPMALAEGVRLSLAGAQDKLAVEVDGDELFLPGPGKASTHILKLPSRDFRGICSNEHFMLTLAAACGIPVMASKVIHLFGREALLIERFDRDHGRRLHQEDVCQALGHPPSHKYEVDGGPSLLDIVRLLEQATTEPNDLFALVRWQAFNISTGNNDGHNKNVALLREPRVRLAPAYDLVCTRAWDGVSKNLAFEVGGQRQAGEVGRRQWERFAEAASLSKKFVIDNATQIANAVHEKADGVANDVIEAGADGRAVRNALSHVKAHAHRSLKLFAETPTSSPFRRTTIDELTRGRITSKKPR